LLRKPFDIEIRPASTRRDVNPGNGHPLQQYKQQRPRWSWALKRLLAWFRSRLPAGTSRRSWPFMMLKAALATAIPSESEISATAAKPGDFTSNRRP
jgi:hypothetical protein